MNQWMLIRLILLVIFVAVLIPAIRLMRQVEDMEKTTGKKESDELKQKRRQLKVLQRVLVVLFLIVLAITMIKTYAPIWRGE